MKLYIYAKSSHRDGLDNVRRSAALANMLKECEPVLCTGDYRAASIAKDTMDVKNAMGIDAMGNLPHTMQRLDLLIYDNEEVTPQMHQQMDDFCTKLYAIGEQIPLDIVELEYFEAAKKEKSVLQKAVFFSDEDYKKWFLDFCKDSKKHTLPLLRGNYFFLDTQEEFLRSFSEIIDEEEYFETVSQTKYLLCASIHTCLESLAAGQNPVFFQRNDKNVEHKELLQKYAIPTASGEDLDALICSFEEIIENYPKTKAIKPYNAAKIKEEILATLKEYAHIPPSLDYSYDYAK